MDYYSEGAKAKELIEKYLAGKIIDIGAGGSPITEDAIAVDGRDYGKVDFITDNLYELYRHKDLRDADVVFSSHCLEHLANPTSAIEEWARLIIPGGYLILYLPEATRYNNYENLEHIFNWKYADFLFYFNRAFCGAGLNFKGEPFPKIFEIVETKEDFRDDCYSFLIISKKV